MTKEKFICSGLRHRYWGNGISILQGALTNELSKTTLSFQKTTTNILTIHLLRSSFSNSCRNIDTFYHLAARGNIFMLQIWVKMSPLTAGKISSILSPVFSEH